MLETATKTKGPRSAPKAGPGEEGADRAALLGALLEKRKTLRERDAALCAEQLRLERDGETAEDANQAAAEVERQAVELINGFAPPAAPTRHRTGRLQAVKAERRAVARAIELLESTETQHRALAIAATMRETGGDWRAIAERRARALLELFSANREAEKFKAAFKRRAGTAPTTLPLDYGDALFAVKPVVGAAPYRFLTDARERQIISAEEFNECMGRQR